MRLLLYINNNFNELIPDKYKPCIGSLTNLLKAKTFIDKETKFNVKHVLYYYKPYAKYYGDESLSYLDVLCRYLKTISYHLNIYIKTWMEKKLSQQYGFANYIHQHNKDMSVAGYTDYCNLFLSLNTILYKAPEYKAQYFFPNLLTDLINYYVNMKQYTRTEDFLDFFIKKSKMSERKYV